VTPRHLVYNIDHRCPPRTRLCTLSFAVSSAVPTLAPCRRTLSVIVGWLRLGLFSYRCNCDATLRSRSTRNAILAHDAQQRTRVISTIHLMVMTSFAWPLSSSCAWRRIHNLYGCAGVPVCRVVQLCCLLTYAVSTTGGVIRIHDIASSRPATDTISRRLFLTVLPRHRAARHYYRRTRTLHYATARHLTHNVRGWTRVIQQPPDANGLFVVRWHSSSTFNIVCH